MAGKGDLLPVSAFPVDGTWPTGTDAVGEAQHRARDPGLGRGDLHPVQQVRAGLPARGDPRQGLRPGRARASAPATFKSMRLQGQRSSRARSTRSRWRPRTAPAARCASMVCPAKDKANPRHKAIDMAPQRAAARGRARELRVLPRACPRPTARRVQARRQGHAVPPAALRVLGRLRRLRRDAVRQAADAALRRPRCSSPTPPAARRSTAATCRRRRTRSNRDGRGPAWSNSLFEDNAEFGLGMRLAVDTAPRARRASCCSALRRAARRRPRRGAARRRPGDRGRASRRSASACAALQGRARAAIDDAGGAAAAAASPTTWCKKSVWIVGGDGWAYDIGYGGLDHVLALRPRRQRPRARHRGLLEHRRPAVEGDAARRGGQVRRGRQGDAARRTSA